MLRAFLDSPEAAVLAEGSDVAAALRGILARSRAAHARVVLDEAAFGRFLRERLAPDRPPAEALARLRGTELFLACACLQGDEQAIATLERDFLVPAAATLRRAGAPPADVDDAVQTLCERLFVVGCKIREYSGRGPLAGWIRVSLARQHATLLRGRGVAPPPPPDDVVAVGTVDPELALVRRRYAAAFQGAFEDAFGRLTPEQRNILRFQYVEGLNLDRIAPLLGVSRATAGRRMIEAKKALLDGILALVGERIRATPSEVASLFTIVRSTLYGSLTGLLGE